MATTASIYLPMVPDSALVGIAFMGTCAILREIIDTEVGKIFSITVK